MFSDSKCETLQTPLHWWSFNKQLEMEPIEEKLPRSMYYW